LNSSIDRFKFSEAARLEAVKISKCGAFFVMICECGARVKILNDCRSAWCRRCRRTWEAAALEAFRPVVDKWIWPSHAVLTVENPRPGLLRPTMRKIVRAFRRLRQRALWKRNVGEAVYAWGLTFKRGRWHPHVHVAMDCRWIEAKDFTKAWLEVCMREGLLARHTYVRRAFNPRGLIRELLKGTRGDMKHLARLEDPQLHGEAVAAFRGRPWFRPLGPLAHDMRAARDARPSFHCPGCGARVVYKEWRREGPYSRQDLRHLEIHNALWADFYEGFDIVRSRPSSAIPA